MLELFCRAGFVSIFGSCISSTACIATQPPGVAPLVRALWAQPIENADHLLRLKSLEQSCVWRPDDVGSLRLIDADGIAISLRLPKPEQTCSIIDVKETTGSRLWITVFVCEEASFKTYLVESDGSATLRGTVKVPTSSNHDSFVAKIVDAGDLIASWSTGASADPPQRDTFLKIHLQEDKPLLFDATHSLQIESYTSFADGHFLLTSQIPDGVWLFDDSGIESPKHLLKSVKFRLNSYQEVKAAAAGPSGSFIVLLSDASKAYALRSDGTVLGEASCPSADGGFARLQGGIGNYWVWLSSRDDDQLFLWDVAATQTWRRLRLPGSLLTPKVPFERLTNPIRVVLCPRNDTAWIYRIGISGAFLYNLNGPEDLTFLSVLPNLPISGIYRFRNGRLLLNSGWDSYLVDSEGRLLNGGHAIRGEVPRNRNSGFNSDADLMEFPIPASSPSRSVMAFYQRDRSWDFVDNTGMYLGRILSGDLQGDITDIHPLSDLTGFWVQTQEGLYFLNHKLKTQWSSQGWSHVQFADDYHLWLTRDGVVHYLTLARNRAIVIDAQRGSHRKIRLWDGLWPTNRSDRAWALEQSDCYLLGTDINGGRLQMSIGGSSLDITKITRGQHVAVEPLRGITIDFGGVLPFSAPDDKGLWTVTLSDTKGNSVVRFAQPQSTQLHFDWPSELTVPSQRSISVHFEDRFGTQITIDLPPIKLDRLIPFWKTPLGHSLILWVGLVLVAFGAHRQERYGGIRKYAPAVLTFISVVAPPLLPVILSVDRIWFWSLCFGTVGLLSVWAACDAKALRRLADIFPLDLIIPSMLRLPPVRRRFFRDYINDVQIWLEVQRKAAKERDYVPIPIEVRWPISIVIVKTPDETLARVLSGGQTKTTDPVKLNGKCPLHVLITSPGGQGKSALLRRLVALSIDRFRETGNTAIPIICNRSGSNIEQIAESALGMRYALGGAFKAQLENGFFLLVIDGLTEQPLKAEVIEHYIKCGYKSPLLVSSRPNDSYEAAFMADQLGMIVTPKRLDEQTIGEFEETYLGTGGQLSPSTRKACSGPDGTYLPILVRLAATAQAEGKSDVQNVADIFQAAFQSLLKDRSQYEAAMNLCLDTYWKTGSRSIAAGIQAHQNTIKELLGAGILVSYNMPVNPASNTPHELRFFHDAMQDFLTADGLFNLSDDQGWTRLLPAAGAPWFTATGSELFSMCIHVFRPAKVLRVNLLSYLFGWADDLHRLFSAELISKGVASYGIQIAADTTITRFLKMVIDRCNAVENHEAAVQRLAALYAHLAPIVWEAHNSTSQEVSPIAAASSTAKR